ncbi:MFS general substrate transporter [Amylocystis lapponica]|nr:MFS general substrate transporter [Amylocystis lapponica]
MDTPMSEKTHVDVDQVAAEASKKLEAEKQLEDGSSPSPDVMSEEEWTYPDGGRGWLVVLGCVIYSSLTLGWAYAWGVVQDYYQKYTLPNSSGTILSLLGSMSGVIMTIFCMVTGKLGDRYSQPYVQPLLALGACFWTAGMLCSAFCTELWQFFLTQGLLQGIANALIFPLVSILGGAAATLMLYGMLYNLGVRKTFAIYSALDAVLLAAAYFMIEERRRPGFKRPPIVWIDRDLLKDGVFWSLAFCFLFTTFGYLSPIFYLPTFTGVKFPHDSELLTVLPLTALNLAAACGRTTVGLVADRIGPVNALLIAVYMSGLTQIVIWNVISTYAGIIVFAILYGFFCGCFISLSPAVAARIYGPMQLAGLSGMLLFFNLPGNAAGAPIGGAILNATGGNWHAVASYSGAMQIVGASVLLYARFKREPKVMTAF